MAGVLNKFMDILGFNDEVDEEDESKDSGLNNEASETVDTSYFNKKKQNNNNNKVVNMHMHTSSSVKVVISKPKEFDEAMSICDDLKNRKIVVVNTTILEQKVAQRLLDFMGGASFVLGGDLQELEKGVYMLTPSNVEVSKELTREIAGKSFLNWNK